MGTAIGDILEREEISLDYLNGRTLGIDSYNILYQFLSIIRSRDGSPLMDSRGRVTSHLTGLLYRTVNLLEKGLKPVFVFDGKPHKLKSATLAERSNTRTEAGKKFKDAREKGDEEAARKYAQQAVKLSDEMVADAKKLVELMGLPIVQASSEGEAQIAAMVETGDLQGCVSQDYDALLFGAKQLFRNITITGKRKAPGKDYYYDIVPEKIDLQRNLDALGIDRRKLVWIGILAGTDFNKKFPRVGAKTALALVKQHSKFEEIIKATKHAPEFDYREIEEIFLKPSYSKDYKIEFTVPKADEVKEFLVGEHDFSEERVESALSKLQGKAEEKGKQSRLGQWG